MSRLGPALVAIGLVAVGVFLASGNERYCTIWPSIDTEYAFGFSERNFTKIWPGMSPGEVERLLGHLLHRSANRGGPPLYSVSGDEEWHYTQDGKAPIGDWAWPGRQVLFDKGRVVATASHVYRDQCR